MSSTMYGIEPPYLFSEKSMKRPEVKVDVKINIAACLWQSLLS